MHVFVEGIIKIITGRELPDGGKYFEYHLQSSSGDVAITIAGKDYSEFAGIPVVMDLQLEKFEKTKSVNVYKLKLRAVSPQESTED